MKNQKVPVKLVRSKKPKGVLKLTMPWLKEPVVFNMVGSVNLIDEGDAARLMAENPNMFALVFGDEAEVPDETPSGPPAPFVDPELPQMTDADLAGAKKSILVHYCNERFKRYGAAAHDKLSNKLILEMIVGFENKLAEEKAKAGVEE